MEKDNEVPEIETLKMTTESGEEIEVVKKESFENFQKNLSSRLEQINSELEKERQKDKNFSNLRKAKLSELSEEEANKLSEREKALMAQQEELDSRLSSFEKQQTESWKNKALQNLGVTDEDEITKVLGQFDRLIDKANTEDQVVSKMRTAYSLAYQGRIPTGERGVDAVIPYGGGGRAPKKTEFSDTQKELGSLLGFKSTQDKK